MDVGLLVCIALRHSGCPKREADTIPTDDRDRVRDGVSGRVMVSNAASE